MQLCQRLFEQPGDEAAATLAGAAAVFISNAAQAVPLWEQRQPGGGAGEEGEEEGPVVWDYHVLLISAGSGESGVLVYDLDSRLSFPCTAREYAERALRAAVAPTASSSSSLLPLPSPPLPLRPRFQRLFRVVPARDFLDTFSSDRSHMMRLDGGGWMALPPAYPPIRGPRARGPNDLDAFRLISSVECGGPGQVLDEPALLSRFGLK